MLLVKNVTGVNLGHASSENVTGGKTGHAPGEKCD